MPHLRRSAGILLHPTSLPGPFGIGDLGPAAYRWVDTLARARQSWWQMLPLCPTGAGDSPYQGLSTFAGNTLLLSPEALRADGLVSAEDVDNARLPAGLVDYGAVIHTKGLLLQRAREGFQGGAGGAELRAELNAFRDAEEAWLSDYALFAAIKAEQGGGSWFDWQEDLVLRKTKALAAARKRLHERIGREELGQFLFARQWQALKRYAHGKGVRLIGDLPIFVAGDSVDVWANPKLFQLDKRRQPRVVAGVPPDYFSQTGQRWGNPHYDWAAMRATGFAWWVARLRATLAQVDLVRLDHFRGFVAAWEVPADCPTAQQGEWVPGPAVELFETFRRELGKLPMIAEDLGVITPDVDGLRRDLHLPGMRILQFAFGHMAEERFLPHNYEHRTVVYTGTHDNDTTAGWHATLGEPGNLELRRYLPATEESVAWDLIRAAWASVADLAVAPLQDLLSLGTEARMNYPGKAEGNWRWRAPDELVGEAAVQRLGEWTQIYGRAHNEAHRGG
jgi:4-alpha-glucanotransferase